MPTYTSAECPKCKGTGWYSRRRKTDGYWFAFRCSCLNGNEMENRVQKLLQNSHIDSRFQGKTFDSFTPEGEGSSIFNYAKSYCENFEEKKKIGEGLFLTGPTGTGKTHLAVAILDELIRKKQVQGVFAFMPDLLDQFRKSYGKNKEKLSRKIEEFCQAELLVLDDIGAEKCTPWVQEKLYVIVNSRYTSLKPTILTSELDWQALEDKISEKTVSRLMEMCLALKFEGKDYRKKKAEEKAKQLS